MVIISHRHLALLPHSLTRIAFLIPLLLLAIS